MPLKNDLNADFPGGPEAKAPHSQCGGPGLVPGQGPGASLVAQTVKNPPVVRRTWVRSVVREDSPGGCHGNPPQYSCLENPHARRSLAGYSPCGHKESDMTE